MAKVQSDSQARKEAEALLETLPTALAAVVYAYVNLLHGDIKREKDPKRRRALARPLVRVYEILRPRWSASTLQAEVARALDEPAMFLAKGVWTEDVAVDRAVEQIHNVLSDLYARPEYVGSGVAPRSLVLECLRSAPAKRGRPVDGKRTRSQALFALYQAFGISGASSHGAVSKMLRRRSP
jgi:hypothetical protein